MTQHDRYIIFAIYYMGITSVGLRQEFQECASFSWSFILRFQHRCSFERFVVICTNLAYTRIFVKENDHLIKQKEKGSIQMMSGFAESQLFSQKLDKLYNLLMSYRRYLIYLFLGP